MSFVQRVFFDTGSATPGRISSYTVMPAYMDGGDDAPGLVVLEQPAPGAYVLDGAIAARPANPTILTDTLLNGLPQPCTIAINGTVYHCADDHADLSLPPGEYRITVSAWPYLDANFTLRV